ncbi:beta-phosphoglucomutase [Flavobacterium sp.]|jgi:beta-phosphoglucomutase|uniref:beta-phosphoglucomutase n=1 Tax=Flavobacterium sp. TaxID=239 RepID=UPI0037C15573
MNKKAFIFDLDGVIVDTAKFHFLAWKKLADSLNINFTHEINEQLKGVSRVRSLEIILSQGNVQASQEDKNNWLVQKNEDYLAFVHQMDKSEILPRVEEVLQFLKTNNQYVVLGSASKNARPILEKVNILHYFDALVDGNDVTNAKPDPEVFLQGANQVQVAYKDAIVFEDSIAGIQAANVAGMTSVGIGEKEVLHESDFCFRDFTEMSNDFIMQLINK